ncbi:hypothetical protein VTI74DRAFT_4985 [Chaetomium olivicolor]
MIRRLLRLKRQAQSPLSVSPTSSIHPNHRTLVPVCTGSSPGWFCQHGRKSRLGTEQDPAAQQIKTWETREHCVAIEQDKVINRELIEHELLRRPNGDVLQPLGSGTPPQPARNHIFRRFQDGHPRFRHATSIPVRGFFTSKRSE